MSKIQIFDPALCCSSGICGVDVDQALVAFAADVDWLKQHGGDIERFNLAQQPLAFAENPTAKAFLERSGAEALPLISDAAGLARAQEGAAHALAMPACDPLIAPVVYAVPVQLLAYHAAMLKGTDVDQPRNIAKSVTVE